MLDSDFGTKVVLFILALADQLIRLTSFAKSLLFGEADLRITADALIQWTCDCGGARNNGSSIQLNPSHNLVSLAGELTHEAVEVYFQRADGINAATLPMDYVAEYFQGLVVQQLDPTVAVTALGQTYNEWLHDPHSPATGPNGRYPGEPNDAQLTGIDNENYLGNPMGLSAVMLSWEQNPAFANCVLGGSDSIIC
jgi:hypothetical protein